MYKVCTQATREIGMRPRLACASAASQAVNQSVRQSVSWILRGSDNDQVPEMHLISDARGPGARTHCSLGPCLVCAWMDTSNMR